MRKTKNGFSACFSHSLYVFYQCVPATKKILDSVVSRQSNNFGASSNLVFWQIKNTTRRNFFGSSVFTRDTRYR